MLIAGLLWWKARPWSDTETGNRQMHGNWLDPCSIQNSNSSRFPDSLQFCGR